MILTIPAHLSKYIKIFSGPGGIDFAMSLSEELSNFSTPKDITKVEYDLYKMLYDQATDPTDYNQGVLYEINPAKIKDLVDKGLVKIEDHYLSDGKASHHVPQKTEVFIDSAGVKHDTYKMWVSGQFQATYKIAQTLCENLIQEITTDPIKIFFFIREVNRLIYCNGHDKFKGEMGNIIKLIEDYYTHHKQGHAIPNYIPDFEGTAGKMMRLFNLKSDFTDDKELI